MRRSNTRPLPDHVLGNREQRRRHGEAERLGAEVSVGGRGSDMPPAGMAGTVSGLTATNDIPKLVARRFALRRATAAWETEEETS